MHKHNESFEFIINFFHFRLKKKMKNYLEANNFDINLLLKI